MLSRCLPASSRAARKHKQLSVLVAFFLKRAVQVVLDKAVAGSGATQQWQHQRRQGRADTGSTSSSDGNGTVSASSIQEPKPSMHAPLFCLQLPGVAVAVTVRAGCVRKVG